jgi:hypothetical protein
VTAGNDAPVGTSATVTATEDTPLTLNAAAFGFTDPLDAPANNFAAVKIASLPTAGALTLSGAAVTAGQSIRLADIDAGNLVFTPGLNGSGAGYASFTFRVQDDGGTANGGVDLDTVARTMTIDVTPVNDAPAGTSNTVTAIEDTPFVFTTAAFGFTDPADTPANAMLAVRITTLPTAGALTLNGIAVTAGQAVSVADVTAGNLKYTPAANASGAGHASFTFQVQDDGWGADLDTVARMMTIDITAVNDAPAGADITVTAVEDMPFVFTAAIFGFTDPDDTPANDLAAVHIATLPAAGLLTLGGVAVTAGQAVSAADIAAGNLVFTAAANASGAGYASLTFRVQDNGGVANGGVDLDALARTITIDVAAANDPPVGASNTIVTLEDTALVFDAAHFGFSDPDDTPANSLLGVGIASLPTAGTLELNGTPVSAGQIISVADIDAGRLVFTPAPDANGAAHSSFTFQVQDDGGTANGGVDLDSVARTMTIDITAVNDAPVGTNRAVTLNEDTAFAFTTTSFGFSDSRDTPANSLLSVTIATLPAAGTLTLEGAAVVAGQSIGVADIAAGKLVYTSPPNANGAGYANFGFRMQDDGGTANGGADLDPVVRNMTINVASVNDRPVGTDNTVTANEDVAFAFSAAAFGLTDPDDSPANTLLSVRIVSLPGAGVLALDGVAISAGQSISAAALNAGRLTFTAAPDAHGAGYASFTFEVRDNGGTARGGLDTDATARTMTINVSSVNDAPVGAAATLTTTEETPLVFNVAAFGFGDPRDTPGGNLTAVKITSLPVAGSLTLAGTPLAVGQFVTVADIAASRLVYTPDVNGNGAGYASFTFQVQDDGGAANGGADLDAVARALTIDVTPVNDAPTGTDRTVATQTNTAFTFNTAVFGFSDPLDVPADSFLAVQITSLPDAGSLALGNLEVVSGQFISTVDVAAGKLRYLPARDAVGAASASFTFKVQDDGGGADLALVARRITIDVTAPPVAAPVQVVENVIAPPVSETRESTTTATSATLAQAAAQTPAQAAAPAAQMAVDAESPPVVGVTADAAPVNTVSAPAPVQRLDVQEPDREARNTVAPTPVIEAQVIALTAGERAAETGSFVTTSQTRTSTVFLGSAAENREMMTQMDQMREELREGGKVEAGTIAATAATSLSLSVGYVIWLLRGGVLLSTLVSSVPAWRFVDPLPVLGRMDDEDDMDDEADDSLESLVSRGDHAPAAQGDERETTDTEPATT